MRRRQLTEQGRARIKARRGVELVSSGELRVVDENGREVPHDGATLGANAAIKNGWFPSGDAAVVHADGHVGIRDRFEDVVISGAENIS